VFWNEGVHTDKDDMSNRPYVIIKNTAKCILIDVKIPAERNVMQKEAAKKLNTRVYVRRHNECGT
jgi:hypothetical protein